MIECSSLLNTWKKSCDESLAEMVIFGQSLKPYVPETTHHLTIRDFCSHTCSCPKEEHTEGGPGDEGSKNSPSEGVSPNEGVCPINEATSSSLMAASACLKDKCEDYDATQFMRVLGGEDYVQFSGFVTCTSVVQLKSLLVCDETLASIVLLGHTVPMPAGTEHLMIRDFCAYTCSSGCTDTSTEDSTEDSLLDQGFSSRRLASVAVVILFGAVLNAV